MTQKNCLKSQKGLLKSVMVVHLLLPLILIGIVSSILGGITTEAANIKMAEQGNLQIVPPDSSSSSSSPSSSASSSSSSFSSSSSSNDQETFLRRQRDLAKKVGSEGGGVAEGASCTIRVKKIDSLPGKCVKLKGGFSGCQNDRFLDPNNADCEDE